MIDYNKSITNEDISETKRTTHGHGKCEVNGCPRWGHIHQDGRWNCRYHFVVGGIKLGNVTLMLTSHAEEVNWYEVLLSSSEVDWVCDGLGKRAPVGMEPSKGETFRQYRERIEKYINALLKFEVVKTDVIDRKILASGDDTFRNFSDVMPQF